MRVLMLAGRDREHPRAAGGDLQAFAWAAWLASQGHHVDFLGQTAPGLAPKTTLDGVHVHRVAPLKAPLTARRMFREAGPGYDFVYEDPIGAGRLPYLSPLWARRRPVIAVWHQVTGPLLRLLYSKPKASLLAGVEKLLARFYRRAWLWVPSEERRQELVADLGFSPERLFVVPPTIEAVPDEEPPLARRPRILFLGVVRPYKAVGDLLDAFERLRGRYDDIELVIAGRRSDEAYEAALDEQAQRLGVASSVRRLSDVSEAHKQELLASSAILVLPSALEGFGIVVLEANAVGTPVVASTGVPLAAVEDGVNGLRYPTGDIDQLVACLDRLLSDAALRERLSAQARRRAAGFTTDAISPSFEALVARALTANGHAGAQPALSPAVDRGVR